MPSLPLGQMDATEWLRGLPSGSVDLIVTDPPYSSLEKHRKIGTTTRLKKAWFDVVPNEYFEEWLRQAYRVLAADSHCYVMCDWETALVLTPMAKEAGFTCWTPIVWDKVAIGMGYHYRQQYELILFLEKGKRKLNDLGIGNVLSEKRLKGSNYPTQKPVALLKILIEQSTTQGERVCDPFMGSGSAGEAALSCGREFWGCDTAADAVALATERLRHVRAEDPHT